MTKYLDPKLLTERNLAWMSRILEQTQKGQAFLAVGEAHLEGPGGVLDLLKRHGYKIEPVFKKAQ